MAFSMFFKNLCFLLKNNGYNDFQSTFGFFYSLIDFKFLGYVYIVPTNIMKKTLH
jgi:hypothetical protein